MTQSPLTLARVTGDWLPDDVAFDAYVSSDTWNGWAMPLFTVEAGKQIAAAMPDTVSYDETRNRFRIVHDDDDVRFAEAVPVSIEGRTVPLFNIGDSWCWEAAAPMAQEAPRRRMRSQ